MKKRRLFWVAACLSLLLAGCAFTEEITTTTVVVKKDGTVEEHIITDFDKDYYTISELEQSLNQQIADYNRSAGEGAAALKEVEQTDEGGQVRVQFVYASYEDYEQIPVSDRVFFCGTVSEAYDAGYDFVPMIKQESGETISKEAVLELGDQRIVIAEEALTVKVPGKIAYVSEGVVVTDKKEAVLPENTGTLSYIIYE
ncbi:MAG: hypothetical protein J1E61_09810 [Lachnospiraceae bacterium]|nr:hypothetical protein [Lachnospiraceae bacterium]